MANSRSELDANRYMKHSIDKMAGKALADRVLVAIKWHKDPAKTRILELESEYLDNPGYNPYNHVGSKL